jgi:hypothetical protein
MSDFNNNTASLSPSMSSQVCDSLVEPQAAEQEAELNFGFARQRWQNGILLTLQAAAMFAAGIFLLSEIPATPNLKVQMAILSGLLIAGGIVMLPKILVDFFGSIRVDETGIHMAPTLVGFSAPWSMVEKWEIRDCNGATASHSIRVWSNDTNRSHTVPAGFLSHHDLHRLRRVMLASSPSEKAAS